MKIQTKAKCPECGRVFDLMNEVDADEWYYGHDCECQCGEYLHPESGRCPLCS